MQGTAEDGRYWQDYEDGRDEWLVLHYKDTRDLTVGLNNDGAGAEIHSIFQQPSWHKGEVSHAYVVVYRKPGRAAS